MSNKTIILVSIDKDLLQKVDEQIIKEYSKSKSGRKFNRSLFICERLDQYLKIKCGIPYMIAKVGK